MGPGEIAFGLWALLTIALLCVFLAVVGLVVQVGLPLVALLWRRHRCR